MSRPGLHSDAREWYGWRVVASDLDLETVRAGCWRIEADGAACLRDRIQAGFVVELIDAEADERAGVAL
ncbi:hypothetical protein UFOVP1346_3 [uncultured Caudovirales phage]|uniref:Uncharacterized protein n=1 Tax=uncultured Caudovirales phage TaxID=2100421 RepID=A0A6J5QUH0_9CAUD|nr:hypothetical protein UFOVP921_43 [uncultured Caudovirales phage]CAB4187382.1 hypothetical protein UFOVP1156_19 [uncultured Caudovirales phage]CAB4199739.1 hypothetical protein UFOVP1346_3 [uncultured Caudovirales phage]